MKNTIVLILALILVFAISGCVSNEEQAPPPPSGGSAAVITVTKVPANLKEAFNVINEGQTKDDIIKLLGEPLEKQPISGKNLEYWYYESGPDVLQIAFDSGTVSAKRMY